MTGIFFIDQIKRKTSNLKTALGMLYIYKHMFDGVFLKTTKH